MRRPRVPPTVSVSNTMGPSSAAAVEDAFATTKLFVSGTVMAAEVI
jgi:hypothetical protein